MATQNYENHSRLVPPYHFLLSLTLLGAAVGSLWSLYRAFERGGGRLACLTLLLLTVAGVILFWYARVFALKAQDRAIRAEENLRHFALTGSLLDPRITIRQTIALRFAPDAELVELAQRAADESLSEDAIKKAIQQWKPDEYRV